MATSTARKQIDVPTRRQRFKEYMRAFNPTASAREMVQAGFVDASLHLDLYQHLAARADLEPGSQQLLVGGIGSGKTTELILADNWFQKNELISLYVDLTSETDLSDLKSGSLLASFGLHLVRFIDENEQSHLTKEEQASLAELKKAIVEYAHGKKTRIWVDEIGRAHV